MKLTDEEIAEIEKRLSKNRHSLIGGIVEEMKTGCEAVEIEDDSVEALFLSEAEPSDDEDFVTGGDEETLPDVAVELVAGVSDLKTFDDLAEVYNDLDPEVKNTVWNAIQEVLEATK